MNDIKYVAPDRELDAERFLGLVQDVWQGSYPEHRVASALSTTINVTAWDGNILVGSVRILTDGYFFGTVPEILVRPSYQGKGIGTRLMQLAWELSPTSLFFGAQPGNEGFFERLGYKESMQSFVRKKDRT